jgi:hypothetical protein
MIAGALFWRSLRPIFWFSVALVVVGAAYLVATGAAEDVARILWPTLDPAKRRKLEVDISRNFDTMLGAMLIMLPFGAALGWASWRRGSVPLGWSMLFFVFVVFLHMTPFSARLAKAVFPDDVLQAPARQLEGRQTENGGRSDGGTVLGVILGLVPRIQSSTWLRGPFDAEVQRMLSAKEIAARWILGTSPRMTNERLR